MSLLSIMTVHYRSPKDLMVQDFHIQGKSLHLLERRQVKEVTLDMANDMRYAIKMSFLDANTY